MFYILSDAMGSSLPISQILALILGYIIAVVIALGMHELAHACCAYKLGDPTAKAMGRLTLNPFKHLDGLGLIGFLLVGFGWAKPVPINPMNFRKYKRDMFLVSISGVVTNLVLSFIFSGIFYFFAGNVATIGANGAIEYSNSLLYFIHFFLNYSIVLNLALFVFNLMPVYPLDGFNAIRAFTRANNKFVNFMFKYGNIILILLIVTPIFDIVYQTITGYFTSVFFNFWGIFG